MEEHGAAAEDGHEEHAAEQDLAHEHGAREVLPRLEVDGARGLVLGLPARLVERGEVGVEVGEQLAVEEHAGHEQDHGGEVQEHRAPGHAALGVLGGRRVRGGEHGDADAGEQSHVAHGGVEIEDELGLVEHIHVRRKNVSYVTPGLQPTTCTCTCTYT